MSAPVLVVVLGPRWRCVHICMCVRVGRSDSNIGFPLPPTLGSRGRLVPRIRRENPLPRYTPKSCLCGKKHRHMLQRFSENPHPIPFSVTTEGASPGEGFSILDCGWNIRSLRIENCPFVVLLVVLGQEIVVAVSWCPGLTIPSQPPLGTWCGNPCA